MKTTLLAALLAAALAPPAARGPGRRRPRRGEEGRRQRAVAPGSGRGVARARAAEGRAGARSGPAPAEPARRSGSACASSRKARSTGEVSINLPLGLVRAFGEDWPIAGLPGRGEGHDGPTLGEVLRTLDSGQSLVEIEDDEATVRVWVD